MRPRCFAKSARPENRGRRECRALDAPPASCVKKQTHERSHHGHTGNLPAFPAQWFYGLLRALPGDQACLTPSPALLIADLTPALGRQNDTTWPYAAVRSSSALTASTASRPAFVTIAKRPSEGRDRIAIVLILPRRQAKFLKIRNWWAFHRLGEARRELFLRRGLDSKFADLPPVGQIFLGA